MAAAKRKTRIAKQDLRSGISIVADQRQRAYQENRIPRWSCLYVTFSQLGSCGRIGGRQKLHSVKPPKNRINTSDLEPLIGRHAQLLFHPPVDGLHLIEE
jgi:hypothetical protein